MRWHLLFKNHRWLHAVFGASSFSSVVIITIIITDGSCIAQTFPSRKLNTLAHAIHANINTYINIIHTHTHTHTILYNTSSVQVSGYYGRNVISFHSLLQQFCISGYNGCYVKSSQNTHYLIQRQWQTTQSTHTHPNQRNKQTKKPNPEWCHREDRRHWHTIVCRWVK